jgi:hypothetical protein
MNNNTPHRVSGIDLASIGLGFIAWLLPDLHVVLKLGIGLLLIGVIFINHGSLTNRVQTIRRSLSLIKVRTPGTGESHSVPYGQRHKAARNTEDSVFTRAFLAAGLVGSVVYLITYIRLRAQNFAESDLYCGVAFLVIFVIDGVVVNFLTRDLEVAEPVTVFGKAGQWITMAFIGSFCSLMGTFPVVVVIFIWDFFGPK